MSSRSSRRWPPVLLLLAAVPCFGCSSLPALHAAIEKGNTAKALRLVSQDKGLDDPDPEGRLPVHRAAIKGNLDVVHAIVARKPDMLDARSKARVTPLYWACVFGHTDVCRFLLDKGATPNAANNFGGTCLHQAAYNGRVEVIGLLLAKGVKLDARCSDKAQPPSCAPIHFAAMTGQTAALKALHDAGADIQSAAGPAKLRPLHFAAGNGHKEATQYLLSQGAKPTVAEGWTFLTACAFYEAAQDADAKKRAAEARGYYTTAAKNFDEVAAAWRKTSNDYSEKAKKTFWTHTAGTFLIGTLAALAGRTAYTTASYGAGARGAARDAKTNAERYEACAKFCRDRIAALSG